MLEVLSEIGDYLGELNIVSVVLRLLLAMGLGGVLGVEQGKKGRPAGFRTYITVCMASALVMLTGQYVFAQFETGDPARLGAQVISGIGFLGAAPLFFYPKSFPHFPQHSLHRISHPVECEKVFPLASPSLHKAL